jgi:hypothetical protein
MQVERTPSGVSGGRLRNTWVTCPAVGDNTSKDVLIPHTILREESSNALWEGPAAHQVVGVVTAHQANDGYLV